ncbi:hypothetical protein ES703_116204 [subsurface metagenome]
MSISRCGLLLNFIGSVLLGAHVINEKFLMSIESKIKNFPQNFFQWFFLKTLTPILKVVTNQPVKSWPHKPKKWASKLSKYFTVTLETGNGSTTPIKWSKMFSNPITYLLAEGILIGLIVYLVLSAGVSLLLLPVITILAFLKKVQRALRSKSLIGLVGLLFLILGFLLHFFANQ